MGFHVLGPLRYVAPDGADVVLGGIKQRATLGFLLLHANQVVATSTLLNALWPDGAPATARKMLHNAVSGLRAALRGERGAPTPATLVTHVPGYQLRVEAGEVDLFRFRELADAGAAELAAGTPRRAVRMLREALDLWRGPVLADLAEAGVGWPELSAVENKRYAVLEDYFEAELATGGHRRVIAELEALVAAAPQRERLCGQLMLALYRCGRQVEALGAYRRTRTAFIDELGIEPGVELRELEQAILRQDPALTPAGEPVRLVGASRTTEEPPRAPRPPTGERKRVSVLVLDVQPDGADPEDVYELRQQVQARVARVARHFGGTAVEPAPGVEWRVLFGVPRTTQDDAERAVRAAHAIRSALPGRVRAAVATGEALVQLESGGVPQVIGAVVADALRLVTSSPVGAIRVADTTRWEAPAVSCRPVPDLVGAWEVTALAEEDAQDEPAAPMLERDGQLSDLLDMLDKVRRNGKPHLAAVLADAGVGKSRLVAEFRRAVPAPVRCLDAPVPRFGSHPGPRALAAVLARLVGARATDPPAGVRSKAEAAVRGLFDAEEADRVLADLRPLLGPVGGQVPGSASTALRSLLLRAAAERPLVVVLDDLHRADDAVLDFVEGVPGWDGPASLLVLATARPELAQRRREWSRSRGSRTVTWLEPLSDAAIDRLVKALRGCDDEVPAPLTAQLAGNPYFATEHVRALAAGRAGEPSALPQTVRNLVAAQLDALPPRYKALLRDAAVVGERVCANAVSAVGELDRAEAARGLEHLEHLELLRRLPQGSARGEVEYAFQNPHIRQVASAQLPRAVREEKQRRATAWFDAVASRPGPAEQWARLVR